MENSLSASLEYASRMKQFNNQLRLLKEKCIENNVYYIKGHQFTIDLNLINYCLALTNLKRQQQAILLDDYKQPVRIDNLQQFYDDVMDLYQRNLNQYFTEYNQLIKDKGEF